MNNLKRLLLANGNGPSALGLKIFNYSTDIVLFKHTDGRLFCTKSGDFSTFDRDGKNKAIIYNFATNGYEGYNVDKAILLPSGTVIVALLNNSSPNTMIFVRSTNAEYTAWEEVHTDWSGRMLYRSWSVAPDGTLMAAEYPTYAPVTAVRLWEVTNDGQDWAVAYTWNGRAGTTPDVKVIFHIHTVQRDPYTGLWWISCGDNGNEPTVYTWDGVTMTLIGEVSQDWRTVSFIFTEDYVIYGADGGDIVDNIEMRYIVKIDKATGVKTRLQLVDSTMFNNEIIQYKEREVYLSCGDPNSIWMSNDGEEWVKVRALRDNPDSSSYTWFYNFVDGGDGRIYGYVTGILREDTNKVFEHGTIILDVVGD